MNNLYNSIFNKRKSKYLKLKARFEKSLKSGAFNSRSKRQQYYGVEQIKKLERQLGLRSNLNLKHWALAFALGFVTLAGNAQDKDTEKRRLHKNREQKVQSKQKITNNARTSAVTLFAEQPLIGDPLGGEVIKGDFDGDGDIDFISFGYYSSAFLFHNDGSGNFNTKTEIWTPSYGLESFVSGDIDGDSDIDFVIVEDNNSNQSRLVYLINDGTGSFTENAGAFAAEKERLQLADIDNDSDLDLLYNEDIGAYTYHLKIATNNGTGTFTEASTLSFIQNQYDWLLGQATSDGFADIVYIDTDTVRVFINNGAGGFTEGAQVKTVLPSYKRSNVLADLDEDGDIDIITEDNEFGWLQNDGTGSFTHFEIKNRGISYPYTVFSNPIVADFDGDSDKDILVWENVQNTSIGGSGKLFTNDGAENFTQAGDSVLLSSNIYTPEVLSFDMDGDLDEDLLAATYFDFELFSNNGSGNFTTFASDIIDVFYGVDFELIDLDGDSDLDVILGGYTPRILFNQGDGTFTNGQEITQIVGNEYYNVEAGDFDGDSDIDIIFSDSNNEKIHLLANDGTNNFSNQNSFTPATSTYVTKDIKAGDIDGDSDLDLVTTPEGVGGNRIEFWVNDGAGNLTESSITATYGTDHIELVDIDGDTDLDIIGNGGNYGINTYINDGVGNFTSGSHTPVPINTISEFTVVDIDGDTDIDVIAIGRDSTNVVTAFLFSNDGTGGFSYSTIGNPSGYLPAAADFDLDGDVDIVFGGEESFNDLWLNDGTEVFALEGSLDARSYGIEIGDLDNDGDIDLFTLESYQGNRVVLNTTNQASMLEQDSTVLVTFYNETGGANWTNNAGWLSADVSTWNGVTVANERVTSLILENNNLVGDITVNSGLDSLATLDISGNAITTVPDWTGTNITTLDISDNQLQFGTLEPNAGIAGINYANQAVIGSPTTEFVKVDSLYTLTATVTGTANQYQWFKDGSTIAGATNSSYTVGPFRSTDNGDYHCEITNTIATGLTLSTAAVTLQQESLIGLDSAQLVILYNETGGANWTNSTGWLSGDVSTWFGVTVANDRVTALNLPNNNLAGAVTVNQDLDSLATVDLSGNSITSIPDWSGSNISDLNVANNNLEFGSLEPNVSITTIDYANQDSIGVATLDRLQARTSHNINTSVSGSANLYQWFKDGQAISGATDTTYVITSVRTGDVGVYHCEITNSIVSGLTLVSRRATIEAEASVSGTVLLDATTPMGDGTVSLLRITNSEGYDTTSVITLGADGIYTHTNIDLGEYISYAQPDKVTLSNYLPTYFGETSSIFWEDAEIIVVDSTITNLNITVQGFPDEAPTGEGTISGVLDEDVPDGGRTEAKKRVADAGASVRRRAKQGRTEEDELILVDYVYTNENGEFNFEQLEEDTYFLNIQYPGYPMDTTSFVEITIGAGNESVVQVEALVTDGKIVVTEIEIIGLYDSQAFEAVKVYPNPTNDRLFINSDALELEQNMKLILLDVSGKEIYRSKLTEDVLRDGIDINNIKEGTYILNLYDNQKDLKKSVKVIVKAK